MVLKLLYSDSECSDVPIEVAVTPKLDTAKNNTSDMKVYKHLYTVYPLL